MLVASGLKVIAIDEDLRDVYLGVLMQDWDTTDMANPVVQICKMLHYPIQTAVCCPDIANDNPPLERGGHYRLKVTEVCNSPDEDIEPYNLSVQIARRQALSEALQSNREDIYEILKRHQDGVMPRPRSMHTGRLRRR